MSELRRTLEEALGHSYTIERELGGGGMSRVFLAEETALRRKVVIKVLPGELAAEINAERFRREIQLAAKLQHPYIVPVLSTGMAGSHPYFTMPFVEGESLRARMQRTGEFPIPETIAIVRDVLEALAYAHESGVVHRDIKPENILLARNHAHVADFGVAKALSASTEAQSGLTSVGVALGTPAYMAPEQAMADPSTDHRADLYAVGAMAYEMLTGHQLFSGRSPQAMLAAHATEAPEPIARRRPNTPAPLADLIMRLLDKRPADRPQSANEALALLAGATTPSGGMAPTARYAAATQSTSPAKRRLAPLAGIAVATALLIAFAVYAAKNRGTAGMAPATDSTSTPSIAVMPFENMSGDPKNDYLGDGLSEELIGGLSRVRGLQVAARTSSFAFKGKNEDVKAIAAKLGVRSVLGGSVRRSGIKLRVSVQLTNASTGYNLWSETYDRDMSDVFAVEDDISKAIVNALAVRLTAGQTGGQIVQQTTTDPEAYDLYLKGRYAWQQRGQHLFDAERFFKSAIARDTSFALAWSGLADTYSAQASWGYITPREATKLAPAMARHAVSLDPSVAETHMSLGFSECTLEERFDEGLSALKRAVELNPRNGTAHYLRAWCLIRSGQFRAALSEGLLAQKLEPLNAQFSVAPASAYTNLGLPDSALMLLNKARKITPTLTSLATMSAFAHAEKGDTAAVRMDGQIASSVGFRLGKGPVVFGAIVRGDRKALDALRPDAIKNIGLTAIYFAAGYAQIANTDSTLVWLDRAYTLKSDLLGYVMAPAFDFIRSDPRYLLLQKKYHIPNPQR